jgi:ATP-binding protein involved in chromosome partitioning
MVLSGKGGVGKSLVAASLALSLRAMGRSVAILDADFHGPSIPWILGVEGSYVGATLEGKLVPVEVAGIGVVSVELMLNVRTSPVIWRGPLKARAIMDLLSQTLWGSRDYLIVDLPPGTGDEPLTIAQQLKVRPLAAVLVLTPGHMVKHIVMKAKEFLSLLGVPLLGVVANMSYFRCPKCGTITNIFGTLDVDPSEVIAEVPIDPELAVAVERSKLVDYVTHSNSEVASVLRSLGPKVEDRLKQLAKQFQFQ